VKQFWVIDEKKYAIEQAIPGVNITASSSSLIGGSVITTTDAEGFYRDFRIDRSCRLSANDRYEHIGFSERSAINRPG
jgi:hypothetical protein